MDKQQIRETIARRAAKELRDGYVVNLGIGLPTLIPNYLPEGVHVTIHSENGLLGMGPRPAEGEEDPEYTDAGGAFTSGLPGAATFDSATSSAMSGADMSTSQCSALSRPTPKAISPTGVSPARRLPAWAERWTSSQAPSA